MAGASIDEDGRRVKGNDVDTAHLLRQHHDERGQGCPADTRNGEQLDEPSDVIVATNDIRLFQDLRVDVVQVPGGLERCIAKAAKRLERIRVPSFLDIPARRFWAKIDAQDQRDRRDEG